MSATNCASGRTAQMLIELGADLNVLDNVSFICILYIWKVCKYCVRALDSKGRRHWSLFARLR
jgi:hypothetical protein